MVQGSFLVTQAVAQALVSCGSNKGSIITVGSIVGKVRSHGVRAPCFYKDVAQTLFHGYCGEVVLRGPCHFLFVCRQVGNLGQVNYASSKAGVQGLSRTAAKELSR